MKQLTVPILCVIVLQAAGGYDPEPLSSTEVPEHLTHFPGLYVRQDGEIIDAFPEDISVAMGYPFHSDRGDVVDGRRITIMCAEETYGVGEEVRVIHVVEAPEPGWWVYAMGPKVVYGEFVDGELASEAEPGWEDPFTPELYDGAVLQSPAVDYNYDITSHVFDAPGIHEIQWVLGPWESNVLIIEVNR